MARGINKVIIVGNLGDQPQIKYTPQGSCVANITVATSESWKDKVSGQQQERTEWHKVVFFGQPAEFIGEYLTKGSKVYVEGSLQTRDYEKDGIKRYITEIKGREIQALDNKGQQNQQQAQPQQNQQPQQPQQNQGASQRGQAPIGQQRQGQQATPQQQGQQAQNFDNFDDDIPFN